MAETQSGINGDPSISGVVDFVNLRAQASETSVPDPGKKHGTKFPRPSFKFVSSYAANVCVSQCIACREKHPLYACLKFKGFSPEQRLSMTRDHHLCMNCLSGDHSTKNCSSNYRCKRCQKPHHTLLHTSAQGNRQSSVRTQQSSVRTQQSSDRTQQSSVQQSSAQASADGDARPTRDLKRSHTPRI